MTIFSASPASGSTIAHNATLAFTVDDSAQDNAVALLSVVVVAKFGPTALWELVHDGTSFGPKYSASSTRTGASTTGYVYTLIRTGGWGGSAVTIAVYAVDAAGVAYADELTFTKSAAAPTAYNASDVLDWIATRILAVASASTVDGAFTESKYRLTSLLDEPDSVIDGRFWVGFDDMPFGRRNFGNQENRWHAVIKVQFGHHKGGGDYSPADAKTVAGLMGNDLQRIVDFVEHPDNYDASNTGITVVEWAGGFELVEDRGTSEVWETTFNVEWISPWITA